MAHIKKMVIQGFKSFAKRTEIVFDTGVNVIIGPNGSGKSNVSDAICFVLGRLSAKSMRAEKSKNLIFMGSKYIKPAKEAFVSITFDNNDRAFAFDSNEIELKRIIRSNGQGIYKINDSTKTRTEIIETLAQAGIDPYGYNIILQGQIQSVVRMHGEERRKIIGEVAGISVYEWRKEKSLKELEKTEERLKEISTVLRERGAILNNLERERSQAQRFKELQETVRRIKATLTHKRLEEKKKEIEAINKAIEKDLEKKEKKSEMVVKIQAKIDELSEKVNGINGHIRQATGVEQGKLREQITNLRAQLEGLKVRREGQQNRRDEVKRRIEEMKKSLPEIHDEIERLRKESPILAKKAQELKKKKEELAELENARKKLFSYRTEIESLKERIGEKNKILARAAADSDVFAKQIEELSVNFKFKNEDESRKAAEKMRAELEGLFRKIEEIAREEMALEKKVSVFDSEIKRNIEIKTKVEKIDTCPLCLSKITEEHMKHVADDCDGKINDARKDLENSRKKIEDIAKERENLRKKYREIEENVRATEREIGIHRAVNEKRGLIDRALSHEKLLKKELHELELRKKNVESSLENLSDFDAKYKEKMLEIEEVSSMTSDDVNTTLLYKERELEKIRDSVERNGHDIEIIEGQIKDMGDDIGVKSKELEGKIKQEEEMNARFNKMFSERDKLQKEIQENSIKLTESQSELRQIEDQINYLKVGKAKLDGESETIEIDLREFSEVEMMQGSAQNLEERMKKAQESLLTIGSINMRALEVYDEMKKEYESVKEKVEVLDKEKNEIMKIIEEIDNKKKRIFMKTFKAINSLFSRNFSKLSAKGIAYLEVENKESIFEGGIDIVVRMAKGKYFDVTSLSGGEQTLVALSLLFAIQEYKPYQFYIFDEIDAALDKRNSERLAALLGQYMKSGQYIVITHNDAIILDSQILYGVSMHEGVSKVLSLRVGDAKVEESG